VKAVRFSSFPLCRDVGTDPSSKMEFWWRSFLEFLESHSDSGYVPDSKLEAFNSFNSVPCSGANVGFLPHMHNGPALFEKDFVH